MSKKPLLGLSMGDPAGIGPEIILKAIQSSPIKNKYNFLVFGNKDVFQAEVKRSKLGIVLNLNDNSDSMKFGKNQLNILETDMLKGIASKGKWSKKTGQASFQAVQKGIQLALEGKVDALVTAPICKQAWQENGVPYTGHTEVLAKMTKTKDYSMMFVNGPFRVALATIHHPLQKAIKMIKKDVVIQSGVTSALALKKFFGIQKPKIAVAGLNPHSGEKGQLGMEEINEIEPAVKHLNKMKLGVYEGPLPADTLFASAIKGKYDLVLCMYHDQGLIPFKMLAFHTGVNVTAGIPMIRTSPDHGTAFDIAGKGAANPGSMIAAIEVAGQMVLNTRKVLL